jgi:hypothetical protein
MLREILVLAAMLGVIALMLPAAINWSRPPPLPALWPQRRAVYALLASMDVKRACELGSGVYPLLARWKGGREGVEISHLAAYLSKGILWVLRKDMRIVRGDATKQDLRDVDAMVLYLGAELTNEVADLHPSKAVVSVAFPLKNRTPLHIKNTCMGQIYAYAPCAARV